MSSHPSLVDVLTGKAEAGLRALADDPVEAARLGSALGWTTWVVDLTQAEDKASAIGAFAVAGQFPDWFGNNWDALFDSLLNLKADQRGHLWIIGGAGVFTQTDPASARMLRQVLGDTVDEFAGRDVPMTVLWHAGA